MPRKTTDQIEEAMDPIRDVAALLDRADEHLDKAEYPQAEKLANEVLASSPLRKENEARAHCILGGCFVNAMLYEEAERHYENAFTSSGSASDFSLQSRSLIGMAFMQGYILGDRTTALHTAERSLEFAVRAQDKKWQAWALVWMGEYLDPTDHNLALEYQTRALALAEESGDNRTIAGVLCNIGKQSTTKGDYHSALEYLMRALPLAEETGAKDFLANIVINIGGVYFYLGDYPRVLEFFQRALSIWEKIGTKREIASALNNIGSLYGSIADYAQALDYNFRALMMLQEAGVKPGISLLGSIGVTYLRLSDYSRALDYSSLALARAEEIGDKESVAHNLGNIGTIYCELSDYPRALEYLSRALDLSVQIGSLRLAPHWMSWIAITQEKLGNHDAAYQGFVDTLRYRREVLKSNDGVAGTLIELGRVLIEYEKPEEGLARLKEGLHLADEVGEKYISLGAHKEFANAYARLGDMAKAFEHQSRYIALDKEIFSEESRKKVEQFNFRVAIANKERDAELAKLRAEQAEAALRLKERDLANTASSLAAQTELLGNFRADLRKIVLRPDRYEPEDILRQVKAKLKELPCEMIDFSKFEGQFATVHPEFRARLETTYPELTPQEVKMCMLIHVNLQSAAIARLMCLSERSVEGHRLNIRKKFGLTKEQSLADALRKIDGK